MSQKSTQMQSLSTQAEDFQQQVVALESQHARIKKSVGRIIESYPDQSETATPSDVNTSGNQQDDFMWEAGL